MKFPASLHKALEQRRAEGILRSLRHYEGLVDFSSNDYLGFNNSRELYDLTQSKISAYQYLNGSGGSRLITGNSRAIERLEEKIASFHNAGAALIFNSGYDANVGLLSSIGKKGDVFLYDELSHASLIDGMRLSFAKHNKFAHNDIAELTRLLEANVDAANIYVVVESIYSMDGDAAPLKEIVHLRSKYGFHLIVDEAHATGVFGELGRGLCNETDIEKECFARIHTFGKALGVHGAAVVGSKDLRTYLINYARSFIYTTAIAPHSYAAIDAAYELVSHSSEREKLHRNIRHFIAKLGTVKNRTPSISPVQCIIVEGNDRVAEASAFLTGKTLDVRAIKSPTVKAGTERLRICIHSFNTIVEIDNLVETLKMSDILHY